MGILETEEALIGIVINEQSIFSYLTYDQKINKNQGLGGRGWILLENGFSWVVAW